MSDRSAVLWASEANFAALQIVRLFDGRNLQFDRPERKAHSLPVRTEFPL